MRVLKGIHSLPTISPMATRSTRKRRHVEKEKEDTQQKSPSVLYIEYLYSYRIAPNIRGQYMS